MRKEVVFIILAHLCNLREEVFGSQVSWHDSWSPAHNRRRWDQLTQVVPFTRDFSGVGLGCQEFDSSCVRFFLWLVTFWFDLLCFGWIVQETLLAIVLRNWLDFSYFRFQTSLRLWFRWRFRLTDGSLLDVVAVVVISWYTGIVGFW